VPGYPNGGGCLDIICLDIKSLKGGLGIWIRAIKIWYQGAWVSKQGWESRYPTSSDKICSDRESPKGGRGVCLGFRTIRISRLQCIMLLFVKYFQVDLTAFTIQSSHKICIRDFYYTLLKRQSSLVKIWDPTIANNEDAFTLQWNSFKILSPGFRSCINDDLAGLYSSKYSKQNLIL